MFACGEHVRTSKGNAWQQQQQQQQPTNPRAQPYLKMCVWGGGDSQCHVCEFSGCRPFQT
jgi:hypothetical protein